VPTPRSESALRCRSVAVASAPDGHFGPQFALPDTILKTRPSSGPVGLPKARPLIWAPCIRGTLSDRYDPLSIAGSRSPVYLRCEYVRDVAPDFRPIRE